MNPLSMKRLSSLMLCAALLASTALLAAPRSGSNRPNGAPTVSVSGTVKDGSGHGWPLYAKIEITSASTDPVVVYSDPLTGAYAADLPDGTAYSFAVAAVGPGYASGGGAVVTAGSPVVADWTLAAAALCTAPGYAPGSFGPAVLSEGFDAGVVPPGWTVENNSTDGGSPWMVTTGADPCGQFDGNRTGGSGAYALVNSNCDAFVTDDTSLITPPVDLSATSDAALRWANDFINTGVSAIADVDASTDGGATWTNIWHASETVAGPGTVTADMSFAAGHAGVQARFHYQGFWAWWWQVDDVELGPFSCTVVPGGLVVGAVTDANTGLGVNGATVTDLASGASSTTGSAPGQGEGFYSLFAAGSGSQDFEASAGLHTALTKSATIAPDAVVGLDFSLAAGLLDAAPRPLSVVVSPGGSQSLTLDVTNTGSGDGSFVLHEVDVPPVAALNPARAIRLEDRRAMRPQSPLVGRDARGSGSPHASPALAGVPLAAGAGNVVSSFSSGLSSGYGLAYDTATNRLWISNSNAPAAGLSGDGLDYEYLPDGTPTGETIDLASAPSPWQGDGTFNARTGMIWQTGIAFLVNSPNQCLFEIDPVTRAVTGKQICGPWGNFPGLVGLAYDYATDTFYAGDQLGVITHVDTAGNVLDTGYVPGVQISGLAYNPTTRHLYIGTYSNIPFEMYVVDPRNNYLPLSGFNVTSGGVDVLQSGGVSLEADCSGHLRVNKFSDQTVYEFESGEQGWCADDISWLSEDPASGTISGSGGGSRPAGGGNTLPVTVTFDSAGLSPGLRLRSLVFTTDTPMPVAPVPVDFTVLFSDVPVDSFAWNYIYGVAGAGVMPGCAPQAPLFDFCPAQVVTRRSMAGFIERAVHGALTPPPVYLAEFNDVLLGSFNADYIQGLVDDRITAGCGGGNYCPDVPVTRAQMAVFVWKGQHGSQAPPACAPPGTFADVPCPGGFAVDYIEGIYAEGITAGCGSGNYCPDAGISNAQMAVFLTKAFAIPYLP